MATQSQIEANRQNAKKSTGPQSLRGKAVARTNALKHGVLAEQVVIPGEDENAFFDLRQRFRDDLQPSGILECELVDQVVATLWRLRRVRRVESEIFTRHLERPNQEVRPAREVIRDVLNFDQPLPKEEEEEHETDIRYGELKQLGLSFIQDANGANAFSKLSRYETALHRSLQRDLHELERLQARRQGGDVQTPVAIDVTIDGPPPSAENKP